MLALIRTTATGSLRRTRPACCHLRPLNKPLSVRFLTSAPPATSPPKEPTAPAKDTPTSVPDSTQKGASSSDPLSTSTSRTSISAASTAAARRRLRTARGSGKGVGGRGSQPGDTASKVYVPSIPDTFLSTHYVPASKNPHDLSSISYKVHDGILTEVVNSMASSLLAPNATQTFIHRMPARHNNLILSSPSEGSSQLLETVTMAAAKRIGADVVTVDVQDLMELTSDMFNGKGAGNPWPVDHLSRGFNPFVTAPVPVEFLEDLDEDSDDDLDDMDDNDDQGEQGSDRAALFVDSRLFARSRQGRHGNGPSSTVTLKEKFEKFWTSLLLAEPASQAPASPRSKKAPKVLYLKDIADIIHTSLGSMLIPALSSSVITLRKAGHNVMIVAGHSPSLLTALHQDTEGSSNKLDGSSGGLSLDSDLADVPIITILQKLRSPAGHSHPSSSLGSNSLSSLLYESFPGPTQTFHHISIPPLLVMHTHTSGASSLSADQILQQKNAAENARLLRRDKAERIKEINCRNLDAVLRFRGGNLEKSGSSADVFGGLSGIGSEVWGFSKVYRVISNALGSLYLSQLQQGGGSSTQPTALTKSILESAMETVTANTTLRKTLANYNWNGEKKPPKPLILPEDCDRYERKLLNSIVDPDKIKTTFNNVVAPAETVHALQTMITLPLIRPQLFSYGLLQNEFLSGLLLFGPPGTGKTLLAKAVAKSSGARMLEIKASDIFDMYVGEGEKNVSAMFSLARKLAPCVIFLDEVDSIFRARGSSGGGPGGGGGNSSQREILNQFMVEWDGLRSSGQNNGIVVMASTNRPFDLDDAVLRRLPRRILVDLPSEEAREKILDVYLSQEKLEDGFDIKELAKKTKFFSGSDLKNLCLSAALASVRESIEKEVLELSGGAGDSGITPPTSGAGTAPAGDKVLDLSPLLLQYKKEAIEASKAAQDTEAKIPGDDLSSPPSPVRVISKRHFDKALTQITPSSSENMESLIELKKWDGLYGDAGKGRRKANKNLGFHVDPNEAKKP
ncbi:hypothetical protein EMPS_05588 [Entomortierella parvispora]|uniref:AAA+ ATPase domain-containing protein n=1 Tax=Entomortierella parvispora TaxID=205924 RepID=A0A9P3HAN6_9FUNG|nr:hypothetical protein EMPS_05588 [Entomortierella parvispora]